MDRETRRRFWAKVDKHSSLHGCWLWTAADNGVGYGLLRVEGRNVLAHRIAYALRHGEVPAGVLVLHDCPDGDNPACFNPAHLFLGTFQDNSRDMVAKGRMKGGRRRHSRAVAEKVRRRVAAGMTLAEAGAPFGVGPGLAWKMVKRLIHR